MAPVGVPLANVVTANAASHAEEIAHASAVPFGPPGPLASSLGQWALRGASAFGADDCFSTATHQISIVNSVHSWRSSFTSNGFVLVLVLVLVPVSVTVSDLIYDDIVSSA